MILSDVSDMKGFNELENKFDRSFVDLSFYFYSFRPRNSFVVAANRTVLGHGSIKEWRFVDDLCFRRVFVLGLIFIRKDSRKFGFGELLTNFLLEQIDDESDSVNANVSPEQISFFVQRGFRLSFSILGIRGKLSEFFDVSLPNEEKHFFVRNFEQCEPSELAEFDRRVSPVFRLEFFEKLRENSFSVAAFVAFSRKTSSVVGLIVLNFTEKLIKCGPFYAEEPNVALLLLKQSAREFDGNLVLALPEENRLAVKIFEQKSFQRSDVLQRIYRGENIFQRTNFERVWAITDDWFSLL